jgi:hypothetical protein
VGWLIVVALLLVGASALLSELCLHHTAATSACIRDILRRSKEDRSDEASAGHPGGGLAGGRAAAPRGRSRPCPHYP